VTHRDVDADRRLSLICDVSCDVTSECNTLPIYQRVTAWPDPVVRLRGGDRPLDLIAIDNLPSLLPREASISFSAELVDPMGELRTDSAPWRRTLDLFRHHSSGDGQPAG
jgi:saccharopine dehydrogenase (NAD+, L-lysine-forming)